MNEDQIQKQIWKYQNTSFDAQNARADELTRDLGDLELRPSWVSKVIRTKHEKYAMLIFNSKAKIFIKKLNGTKLEKKKALGKKKIKKK